MSSVRRPRSDAVANRERILDHAERVLVAEGLNVSLHRLATDLGFGVGTVYRHFATNDDLVLALYERHLARMFAIGESFVAASDPWDRIVAYVDGMIAIALDHPIGRVVAARVRERFPERVDVGDWTAVADVAVAEAREAGVLRPDVTATDIAVLPTLVGDLHSIEEPMRSILVARMRALLLDALRPTGAERPALPFDALSHDLLSEVAHRERPSGR